MGKNDLEKIQSGQDTCRWIVKHPKATNLRWAGDHLTADGPDGRITAANSHYEYPRYIRRKIITQLIAIGLGILLVMLVVSLAI